MFRIRKPETALQPATPLPRIQTAASTQRASAAPSMTSLWTMEQVAVFLGVSYGYVARLRAAGILPPAIRIGNAVRWYPETIIRWALAQTERQPRRR